MNPAGPSPFRQAEERYFSLRGQLDTGRITRAQFDAGLSDLMLRDAQGRYWALGGDTGRWNVFQAGAWVEATPEGEPPLSLPGANAAPPAQSFSVPPLPRTTAPAPMYTSSPPAPRYTSPPAPMVTPPPVRSARPPAAAPAQSGGGCGRNLACGCVFVIVLLVACAAGAYLAARNGMITTATFLNLVGLGPARIEVDNFRDDAIQVSFTQTDAAKNSTPVEGALQLGAFDVKTFHAPNAAKFRVVFVATAGSKSLGTCNLDVHSGDRFQFVALSNQIVVNRLNSPPTTGSDLVVSSSTLCR